MMLDFIVLIAKGMKLLSYAKLALKRLIYNLNSNK